MSPRHELETAIFASNLRKIMRKRGVSQAWLANAVGTSQGAVCLWCGAKREPTATSLKRTAVALEVSVDELLEGIE